MVIQISNSNINVNYKADLTGLSGRKRGNYELLGKKRGKYETGIND